jgi:hypothetical protein
VWGEGVELLDGGGLRREMPGRERPPMLRVARLVVGWCASPDEFEWSESGGESRPVVGAGAAGGEGEGTIGTLVRRGLKPSERTKGEAADVKEGIARSERERSVSRRLGEAEARSIEKRAGARGGRALTWRWRGALDRAGG